MEDNIGVNKIITENEDDPSKLEFKYNFINIPWDDRSKRSKIGIVALLVVIFAAIMACVINNFIMHYRGFSHKSNAKNSEMNCFRVRPDGYRYVARIHSLSSKQLLCVAAVVSPISILANGVCVKSGPIRIHLGSLTDPYCKKGFAVDSIESIYHDGAMSKELVLLSSYEDKKHCIETIGIGDHFSMRSKVFIIGRSSEFGRLSRHYVSLADNEPMNMGHTAKNLNIDSMICVKDMGKCPVKVGDLLVQNNLLFGLAATSIQSSEESKYACFTNLKVIRHQLKDLDTDIKMNPNNLEKLMVVGQVDGKRLRGRSPSRCWSDLVKKLTGLPITEAFKTAEDRKTWKGIVHRVIDNSY